MYFLYVHLYKYMENCLASKAFVILFDVLTTQTIIDKVAYLSDLLICFRFIDVNRVHD